MCNSAINRQKGNIIVMFTIGLFALIAMAALALDGGHLLLNKTRLQNVADSAALAGAIELDEGGTHSEAVTEVRQIISQNLGYADYHELADVLNDPYTGFLTVEFSAEAEPFVPMTSGGDEDLHRYVKVSISNVALNNFLAQILSFNKQVSATALAGPSTALIDCYNDLVPLMVCAKNPDDPNNGDTFYGYKLNDVTVLKVGAGEDLKAGVGAGNFQLVNLPGDQGGNDIRYALAGGGLPGSEKCFSSEGEGSEITTAPGNKVGNAIKGLNTRFDTYDLGTFPPDENICQGRRVMLEDGMLYYKPDKNNDPLVALEYDSSDPPNPVFPETLPTDVYSYSDYLAGNKPTESCPSPTNLVPSDGESDRRVVNLIMADCRVKVSGSKVPNYVGSACFFLNQDIDGGGGNNMILGQFTEECSVEGIPRITDVNNPGPYTIVLYHVPGSKDS